MKSNILLILENLLLPEMMLLSVLPLVGLTGIRTIWWEYLIGDAEFFWSICFWHYTVTAKVAKPQIKQINNDIWHVIKKCHISAKCDSILPGVGPTGIHTIWREHLAGAAEVPGSICFWHYTVRWGHWFCNRVETHRPPGRTMAEPNHRRGSLQQKSNIL